MTHSRTSPSRRRGARCAKHRARTRRGFLHARTAAASTQPIHPHFPRHPRPHPHYLRLSLHRSATQFCNWQSVSVLFLLFLLSLFLFFLSFSFCHPLSHHFFLPAPSRPHSVSFLSLFLSPFPFCVPFPFSPPPPSRGASRSASLIAHRSWRLPGRTSASARAVLACSFCTLAVQSQTKTKYCRSNTISTLSKIDRTIYRRRSTRATVARDRTHACASLCDPLILNLQREAEEEKIN